MIRQLRSRRQPVCWPPEHGNRGRARGKRATALLLMVVAMSGLAAGCGASLNGEHASLLSASEPATASALPPPPAPADTETLASPAAPAATLPPGSPSASLGYTIGPRDVLDIAVFKVPELSKRVQVADSGNINLPLVGDIAAAGKTARDIERDLTAKLGAKYLQSPQVTVFVKEYNSQQVTIQGAVRKPGVYPIKGKTSLLQTIAMAEGLDSTYDATVVVLREDEGQRLAAKFDIDDIKNGTAADPTILRGDTVVVNTSTTKKAFDSALRILPNSGSFIRLAQ